MAFLGRVAVARRTRPLPLDTSQPLGRPWIHEIGCARRRSCLETATGAVPTARNNYDGHDDLWAFGDPVSRTYSQRLSSGQAFF